MKLPRIVPVFVVGVLALGCSRSQDQRADDAKPAITKPTDDIILTDRPPQARVEHARAFIALFAGAGEEEAFVYGSRIEQARAFITLLAKEDFKAAGKDFDDAMVKAVPTEALEKLWTELIKEWGAFKKQGAVVREKMQRYDAVIVTCEFENLTWDLCVVYDPDGKIGGFRLRQPKTTANDKPASYVKKDAFIETEVTVKTGEWSLPGTLTVPTGDGPFPAVVLVHGSGPQDRDETIGPNKMLRDLAWGLASQGIATLRYDKRTFVMRGNLARAPESITVKEETIDDAVSAVELLGQQKGIDKKRIFIVGHSLGAFAAPRIAEAAPNVAGLVVMAGNTRPLEDLILEQLTYVLPLQVDGEDKRKDMLDTVKKQVERAKDPKLTTETPAGDLPLGVPASYWLDLRKYDPSATAAKLKQPMLILQGERDYQVTMVDFEAWKKALADRKNVRLKSYPKLNHLFLEGEGKAKPSEYNRPGHVAEETINDIADWIKKQ
jgi:dienelactone hydrolase